MSNGQKQEFMSYDNQRHKTLAAGNSKYEISFSPTLTSCYICL